MYCNKLSCNPSSFPCLLRLCDILAWRLMELIVQIRPQRRRGISRDKKSKACTAVGRMCGLSTVVTPAGASLMYREIRSYANSIWDCNSMPVALVAQRYPCNLLTRWDVSSILGNGIFLTRKLKNKTKNAQRVWRTIKNR